MAIHSGTVDIQDNDVDQNVSIVLDPEQADIVAGGNATIHLDGNRGDITLRNADCAEEFDAAGDEVDPGTVVVLDDGRLQQSSAAYDKRVAGIVSGAGEFKPALVLDRRPSVSPRTPVALMEKAYCKVDASFSAVEVGDLLTTSPTPGQAMKADDPLLRAFGAVIGKALRPLKQGAGMIPVLVALQ